MEQTALISLSWLRPLQLGLLYYWQLRGTPNRTSWYLKSRCGRDDAGWSCRWIYRSSA